MEVIEEAEDGPVEVRPETDPYGFSVWVGAVRIAFVGARTDRRAFAVNVYAHGRCGRDVAALILAEVEAMAAGPPLVDSQSPVVRDQARRRGYTGPLRGWLRLSGRPDAGVTGAPGDREATLAAVGALIGRPVAEDRPGRGGRVLSALRVGYGGAVRLTVADPPLGVTIPDSPDLMIESVAGAIDTVLAVRDRFGAHAGHLQVVSFDRPSRRPVGPRWAGQADHSVFSIHLNDNLALAAGWVSLHREREAARGRPSSAPVPHPYTRADGVSAHEAWHQIEYKFRGRRPDHAGFRRELGALLGVETLEQAIQGRYRNAPEELRLACRRLVQTVSPYAARNPLEATAEMFKLWWCGVSNPTIDGFGRQLERFFAVAPRRPTVVSEDAPE